MLTKDATDVDNLYKARNSKQYLNEQIFRSGYENIVFSIKLGCNSKQIILHRLY